MSPHHNHLKPHHQGRSRTLRNFYPDMGLELAGSSDFFRNQSNLGSSCAYAICIWCGLSVKINTRKTPHVAQRSWAHLFCVCFRVCDRQKPKDPQFVPHGWQRHYTGGIHGLGSPLYIWVITSPNMVFRFLLFLLENLAPSLCQESHTCTFSMSCIRTPSNAQNISD